MTVLRRAVEVIASLKITIVTLLAAMLLILISTFAQVDAGIFYIKAQYFDTFLAWHPIQIPAGDGEVRRLSIPLPGGFLVGAVLLANLIAAHIVRFTPDWRKAGLLLSHFGLILLIIGMFVSSAASVESRLEIDEGQTKNWTEDYYLVELAVIDVTGGDTHRVVAFPQSTFRDGVLEHAALPDFRLRIHRYQRNADLEILPPSADGKPDPNAAAEHGMGARIRVIPRPVQKGLNDVNFTCLLVEPEVAGEGFGSYLLSNAFPNAETFELGGRRYLLQVRMQRYYLPYSLTLRDFRHDRYAGTEIPKNFSSLVTLTSSEMPQGRDQLISMNNPLRFGGKTFYQAQFKNDEKTSILQVVENPGWTIPYLSCTLIAIGLLLHFLLNLTRYLDRRRTV